MKVNKVAKLEIVDAGGRFDMMVVAEKINANIVQPIEGHQKMNYLTTWQQNAYQLHFDLDKSVGQQKLKIIEERLKVNVTTLFDKLDVNGGKIETGGISKVQGEPIIVNSTNFIDVEKQLLLNKQDKDLKKYLEIVKNETSENTYKEDELIYIAKDLVERDIKIKDKRLFASMMIGLWNSQQQGDISESGTLQIIGMLDRNKNDEEYYRGFKRNMEEYDGRVTTMGTFIWFAKKNGYNRDDITRLYVGEDLDVHQEEIVVEQYVDKDVMYDLYTNENRKILVDAPTGSGKTTASREAVFRWLEEDKGNRYAYFALPTRALSHQSTTGGRYGMPLMERTSPSEVIKFNRDKLGVNFAFGTYDKAEMYTKAAVQENENIKILIIIDEAHKEVTDWDFRRRAINGAYGLRNHKKVIKFVGLSGTPQEVDKEYYDQIVKFSVKNAAPVFNNLKFLTYSKIVDYESIMTKLIQKEVNEGRKVLQFINNKEVIGNIQELLEDMGIKVIGIYSGEKEPEQKRAYEYLMEKERFPEGYDVVLATNVISDGINILNEDKDHTVIISPNLQKSPLFNLSMIKQMSNRFRNQYENLIIPIFIVETITDARVNHTRLYGVDRRYRVLLEQAEKHSSYLKEIFGDILNEYYPAAYEVADGFPHVNEYYKDNIINSKVFADELKRYRHIKGIDKGELTEKDLKTVEKFERIKKDLFTPNKRTLRMRASRDAENYYKLFPYAFVKGIRNILDSSSTESTVADHLDSLSEDESNAIDQHFKDKKELKKADEKEKRSRREEVLTKDIFIELKHTYFRNDRELPNDLKVVRNVVEMLSEVDMSTLRENIGYVDYKGMLALMNTINNTNATKKFRRRLKAVNTLEAYKETLAKTETNLVISKLVKKLNDKDNHHAIAKASDFITNKRLNEIQEEVVNELGLGVEKSDKINSVRKVRNILNTYFLFDNTSAAIGRGKYGFRLVNLDDLARAYSIEKAHMDVIYVDFQKELVDFAA